MHPRKRDVSPSTKSTDGCCSTASYSDLSELSSDVDFPRRSSSEDFCTASKSEANHEDWSFNVKNTFLNASRSGNRSGDEPQSHGGRRSSSMPPTLNKEPGRTEAEPLSPTCSKRKHYTVVSEPVRPCSLTFLRSMNEQTLEALEQMLESCLKPEVVLEVECCSNNQSADVLNLHGATQVLKLPEKLRDAMPDLMFDLSSIVTEKWTSDSKVGNALRFTFMGTQRYPFFPMFPVGERFGGEVHWEVLERMNGAAIHYNWNFCASQSAVKVVKELPLLPLGGINARLLSLSIEDIVTPESTPRHVATAEDPTDASFENSEDVSESSIPPIAMQPVMLGAAPMFVPLSFPQHQRVMVMDSQPMSLQQEAQRAELAAAALRAQIQLQAAESQVSAAHQESGTCRTRQTQTKKKKQNSSPAQPTSVMLRNIPLDLTRGMFLEMLDEQGFMGTYDLVYLPRDFKTGANLGYAFVNLLMHDEAVRMQKHFSGFYRWSCRSAKKCQTAWSSQQGLDEYVDRYRNNPVMHESVPEDFKPAFFRNGVQVDFPAPTRKLKSPQEN